MKNSHISDEELLRALETSETVQSTVTDFNGFIAAFNLKPGPNKIRTTALFQLYKRWSKDPISKVTFAKNMNLVFDAENNKILINIEPTALIQLLGDNKKTSRVVTNSPTSKKHFETFLKKYEIESGYMFLKFSVLFDAYDKWQYENKLKTRLSKKNFEDYMNLYFKSKKDEDEMYFGFDPKILNNLTHEQKLQCLSQKSKLNAIKKENQKKSN